MTTLTAMISPLDWNFQTTQAGLFITACVVFVFLIVVLLLGMLNMKKSAPEKKTARRIWIRLFCFTLIAILLVVMPFLIILTTRYATAQQHGAQTKDMTIRFMYDGIKTTPAESTLPENLAGAIIIYYRFDCPDCRNTHDEIMNMIKDVPNVYFVCSRSVQGVTLMETYPVEKVPSGIYVRSYTYNGALSYTKKILYTSDESGNAIFIPENLQRLITLQAEGR